MMAEFGNMTVKKWGFNENEAIHRLPYGRQCPERGKGLPHRVGIFPIMSLLDGGLPGDICKGICIHCGKDFPKLECFVPKNQPRTLDKTDTRR